MPKKELREVVLDEAGEKPVVPEPNPELPKPEDEIVKLKLSDVNKLLHAIEQNQSDIRVLKESVNRYKLEKAEAKYAPQTKDMRPRATLKVHNGKVILRWKDKTESPIVAANQVMKNGTIFVGEVIKAHLVPLDGSEDIVCDYSEFIKGNEYTYVRKAAERNVKTGEGTTETYWLMEFEDPALAEKYGQVELNAKYLNCP